MSSMPSLTSGSGLGSLAQSARQTHLKGARRILMIVGVLTFAANGFMFWNSTNEVQQLVNQQQIEPEAAATVVGIVRLIYGGSMALGVVFVILGLLVWKMPVPATVTGLVLYIGGVAFYAWLDPMSLANGWLFKILIIAALVKAVQAGIAYKKETEQLAGIKPAATDLGAEL